MRINRSLLATLCCLILSGGAFPVQADPLYHVLKRGETLYGLARSYGVKPEAIAAANGIDDPRKLKVGQKLLIPVAQETYTVKKGDSLYGIARSQGVPIADLLEANRLTLKSTIRPGDILVIPGAGVPGPSVGTAVQNGSKDSDSGTAVAVQDPPSPTEIEDPRRSVPKDLKADVTWPVKAKELAYLQGKLYGVVLTAEKDERVESLSSGTVVSAGPYRGFGKVAIVQGSDGYVYVYGGAAELDVAPGERIAPGASIGSLGIDGLSGKPQLFLFVYKDNKPVDPAKAPRG